MSKFIFFINIILIVIILVFIDWNITHFKKIKTPDAVDKDQVNYKTDNAITRTYDAMGRLSYQLITDGIRYFSNDKISWFINPVLISYDQKSHPSWVIRANKAKLINNKMLYLYGDVQLNNLKPTSNLQKILTENAIINIMTQDISSNDKVTVIGIGLRSVGRKMCGNMRTHTAELIEDINTYYEMENKRIVSKGNSK